MLAPKILGIVAGWVSAEGWVSEIREWRRSWGHRWKVAAIFFIVLRSLRRRLPVQFT